MPESHKEEFSSPDASGIWNRFQKEMLPYLLSILPDELYAPGRESELFVALNKALYDKYVADGALIPPDIQYQLQLDVCSLMPAFAQVKNPEELLNTVFHGGKPVLPPPAEVESPVPAEPVTNLLKTGKLSLSRAKVPGPKPADSSQVVSGKILTLDEVTVFRAKLRREGRRVVVTNGCFDLLHVGHLRYLTEARAFGDFLWVGLNGDASVHELKGPGRPLVSEADRAELLAAWRIVDAVTIFPEVRATAFLRVVQPDIYVKGGDYTAETLNREEAGALNAYGSRIEIVKLVPGKSTTNLVKKMAENKARS